MGQAFPVVRCRIHGRTTGGNTSDSTHDVRVLFFGSWSCSCCKYIRYECQSRGQVCFIRAVIELNQYKPFRGIPRFDISGSLHMFRGLWSVLHRDGASQFCSSPQGGLSSFAVCRVPLREQRHVDSVALRPHHALDIGSARCERCRCC